MNYKILFLCVFYLNLSDTQNIEHNEKLEKYLMEKNIKFETETNLAETNKITFEVLDIIDSIGHFKNVNTFKLFDKTFFLLNNELHEIVYEDPNFILHFHYIFRRDFENVTFLKAKTYKGFGIMAININSETTEIYKFNNNINEMKHIQSIANLDAVDAHLFSSNDNLYLTVAINKKDNLGSIVIYKWTDTYFDEIDFLYLQGPGKVTSFKQSDQIEIIIVLQSVSTDDVPSILLEFEFDKLKKIQKLFTVQPRYLTLFEQDNQTSFIIWQNFTNNMYLWNGKNAVVSKELVAENVITGAEVIHDERSNLPLIITAENNAIVAYVPDPEDNINRANLIGNKEFSKNFSILGIHKGEYENRSVAFIFGLEEDNAININVMAFKIHSTAMESHLREYDDVLERCFTNLEQAVYSHREKLNNLRETSKTVLLQHNIMARALTNSHKPEDNLSQSDNVLHLDDINNKIADLQLGSDSLSETMQKIPSPEDNTLIINGNVEINGSITSNILQVKDLRFAKINAHSWTPEQWLLYSQPQTITGPVVAKEIIAKSIETANPVFNDVLLSRGNQRISSAIQANNITVSKLYTNQINDIQFQDIYLKSNPQVISGKKTFKEINAADASIKTLNKENPETILKKFSRSNALPKFSDNLTVHNLWVEEINGVNWNEFKNSVFRIGKTPAIEGDLIISKLKTLNLKLKQIQDIDIEELMTTSTDQVVNSNFEFHRIFAENIEATTINNINFQDSIVHFNNATIKSPVKTDQIKVEKDLTLLGKFDKSKLMMRGDHIVGTNESDLLQIYNGKITIKGNLHVKNLIVHPDAKMVVADNEMNPNLSQDYWTKTTNQEIPVHFEALNGITSPHLTTHSINGIQVNDFMLNNDDIKATTNYYFENATVFGNILLNNNENHTPDLEKISKNAVKTTGSFVISGKKIYSKTLRAQNLVANMLQDINVYNAVTTKFFANITGNKQFEKLIVKGDLISHSSSVQSINDININELQQDILYIDKNAIIDSLDFKSLSATNLLITNTLNDKKIHDYISGIEKMQSEETFFENLQVFGNVTIDHVSELKNINNHSVENMMNDNLKISKEGLIKGDLRFTAETIKVNHLEVAIVNEIVFPELTPRLLYKKLNQDILAPYTFENLKTNNVLVENINNYSVANLVNTASSSIQEIFAPNGLRFSSPAKIKSLSANDITPCDLGEAYNKLRYPPANKLFEKMQVNGNVTFLNRGFFNNLFENAVTKNTANVLKAPAKFKSLVADNIFTNHLINDVNLGHVLRDALVKDSLEEQVVTGRKVFPELQASNALVLDNTDIPLVNEIPIIGLNSSIIWKDVVHNTKIKGTKTLFAGLQSKRFYADKFKSLVPTNLVSLDNLTRPIPSATFEFLEINENLNINFVNQNIDFNKVFNDRLLCHSDQPQITNATYFFEYLTIVGNLRTPGINDIKVNDIVFDVDEQIIEEPKQFINGIEIDCDAIIGSINGEPISENFESSVFLDEVTNINGSMIFLRESEFNGNVQTETINGYPVGNIVSIVNQNDTGVIETDKIIKIIQNIDEIVEDTMPFSKRTSNDFMYIEKTSELQISIKNVHNAKTFVSNKHVLLHLFMEENGNYCGLPKDCACPIQHTVQISPEYSLNDIVNKGTQRIFTFSDGDIIVHFLTSSISTSEHCRTETSKVINEVSHMTWNTLTTEQRNGSFYMYPRTFDGYISSVEFFTLRGYTYMVIGRYYNPVINSHDLDCIVVKFNKDKNAAEEIQKIPTKGAWTLHILNTTQGVNLIIGNTKADVHDNTRIYRFNEEHEQFELFGKFPMECTEATGIVLESDSFIIIANKNNQLNYLRILKYNVDAAYYYIYQYLDFDYPIIGISTFYAGDTPYLNVVTGNGKYYIYSYKYLEKWQLKSHGEMEGLRNLIPFKLNKKLYLFAPRTGASSLLTIVNNGSN